jgi:hypothetical protein
VNFIGNPRRNNYIPGYFFKVPNASEFASLKNCLATSMYETQNKVSHEKAEEFDEEYFSK